MTSFVTSFETSLETNFIAGSLTCIKPSRRKAPGGEPRSNDITWNYTVPKGTAAMPRD